MEAALAMSSYVENITVHAAPFNSYCVALVVAAQSALEKWALQQGLAYSDFSDLCQKQEAVKEVLGALATVCVLCSSEKISWNSIRHRSYPKSVVIRLYLYVSIHDVPSIVLQFIFTVMTMRNDLQQYLK